MPLTPSPSSLFATRLMRLMRWTAWLLAGALLLLVLSAAGFRWIVWPKVADLLNDPTALSAQAAPFLQTQGHLIQASGASAQWRDWLIPTIELDQLVLRSAAGEMLAQADGIRADFGLRSFLSIWAGQPVFGRLSLSQLQVSVSRAADGHVRLAGFPLASSGSPGGLLDLLAQQGPVTIARADLQWQDRLGSDARGDAAVRQGEISWQGVALKLRDDETLIGVEALDLSPLSGLLARGMPGFVMAGDLQQLELGWSGPLEDLARFEFSRDLPRLRLRARLERLGLGGVDGVPAFSGLSGDLQSSGDGGSFILAGNEMTLASERFLRRPEIQTKEARGQVRWEGLGLAPPQAGSDWPRLAAVALEFRSLVIRNDDLTLNLDGRWAYAGEDLGQADLRGTLGGVQPERVAEYLPRALGQETHAWIARAFRSGRPVSGQWELRGPLASFPFQTPGSGLFQARLKFEDLRLDYARGWPEIEAAFVDLRFDGPMMQVSSRQARMAGNPLVVVDGEIADVLAQQPVLTLKGRFESDLPSLLGAVNRSPVRGMLGDLTSGATAKGPAALDLALAIDLNDTDNTTVEGGLRLDGAALLLEGGFPQVSNLKGELRFTQRGLTSMDWQGQSLGGPIRLTHRVPAQGPAQAAPPETRLAVSGTLEGGALEEWLGRTLDFPLRGVLLGRVGYEVAVSVQPGEVRLEAQSALKGLSVRLPAPARKAPEQDWGLRLGMRQTQSAAGSRVARWTLQTQRGPLQAVIQQSRSSPGAVGQTRGSVSLGAPLVEPMVDGTVVRVASTRLNLGQWLDAIDRRMVAPAAGEPTGLAGGLTRLELSAGRLELGEGTALSTVQAQVAKQAGTWVVELQSQEAVGRINWQPNVQSGRSGGETRGAVTARLGRLWLEQGQPPMQRTAGEAVDDDLQTLTSIAQARRWPSVDLVVDDFRRGPQQFGRLTLDAAPAPREASWQIRSVLIENPDAVLRGSGRWEALAAGPAPSQTSLDLNLDIKSSEGLLARLGHPGLLRATPGQIKGQLNWPGAPTDFRVSQLGGQLFLDLKQGQFLKAEPGLSKLVSVVNLQSLPKRITLDFRDIFSAGFAYERVRGDLRFSSGEAMTDNLRIVGIQASVFIEGTASIVDETQQIRVLVLPELNVGLASLGYALINPAIGLGSFLAQYVLRDPLRKVLAYEYRLTGPWMDPIVTEMPRRSAPEAEKGSP